jgi:periplasmic divalent cation tolerance protein
MEKKGGAALVYTTFPSAADATNIGRALVEARLAACVNIFPGMMAIFEWEGKMEAASEAAMLIKTRAELTGAVMEEVRKLHPYDTPALLVIDVESVSPLYMEWIRAQTNVSGRG